MIRLSFGNPGSGKTACEVREIFLNKNNRKTYSNIQTKGIKHNITIKPEMIVQKKEKGQSRKGEIKYDLALNTEFWKGIKEPINVVLDEAHTLVNPRRSMSKVNIILTDWLALVRRVLGQTSAGYGTLVLISQLPNRIDVIAREMATQVRYHLCHYIMTCNKCRHSWGEDSDMPEPRPNCPRCGNQDLKKHHHRIEVWCFDGISSFLAWKTLGQDTYYDHYMVKDIEKYFPHYDTLQWDNMFSELY